MELPLLLLPAQAIYEMVYAMVYEMNVKLPSIAASCQLYQQNSHADDASFLTPPPPFDGTNHYQQQRLYYPLAHLADINHVQREH
mmetsp:Transcript_6890/g.10180  ORF Transcript_6890/g.10180 Transcript_6890/m.10180 type:complete len:85 (-) Transcript_6890:420-674(-)